MLLFLANSYKYVVSSTHIAVCTMIGAALASYSYKQDAQNRVHWFPTMTLIFLSWLLAPLVSFVCSPLLYELLKRVILQQNARERALILSPYIAGVVMMTICAFAFGARPFRDFGTIAETM